MNALKTKLKFTYIFTLLLASGILLNSCSLESVGPDTTETITLDTFQGIKLAIAADVRIIKGETQSVVVTGPANVIEDISREVNSGIWTIELDKKFKTYNNLNITITTNHIEEIDISGSGDVTVEGTFLLSSLTISGSGDISANTDASRLESRISGSGGITVGGSVDEFINKISGSGNVKGFELEAKQANIDISGSGNVEIYAINSLDVKISGSGDMYYKGTPSITQNISGSGNLVNSN